MNTRSGLLQAVNFAHWLGHNLWPAYAGKHFSSSEILLRCGRNCLEVIKNTCALPCCIYHQCMCLGLSHIHKHTHIWWMRRQKQTDADRQCKGLFTNSCLTSMTHKQLPFSPMKGDPLPWHGTSRCITKPHSLIMVSASFCYTGKHLLIFVTIPQSPHMRQGYTCFAFFFKHSKWKLLFSPQSVIVQEHPATPRFHALYLTCRVPTRPHCQKLNWPTW